MYWMMVMLRGGTLVIQERDEKVLFQQLMFISLDQYSPDNHLNPHSCLLCSLYLLRLVLALVICSRNDIPPLYKIDLWVIRFFFLSQFFLVVEQFWDTFIGTIALFHSRFFLFMSYFPRIMGWCFTLTSNRGDVFTLSDWLRLWEGI